MLETGEESSEFPPKKAKFSENQDPLKLIHSDVHGLIFQHFGNFDVLESSTVSKFWFTVTENSFKCMEKLHLRIVVPYSEERSEKYLRISEDLTSNRKYQNIYLHNFRFIVPEILKILQDRNWKKVYISTRNLRSKKELQEIVKIIEPTVENLSISLTSVESFNGIPNLNFTFPNLKNLDLSRCHGLLMEEVSENLKTLKILKIDQEDRIWMKHQKYLHKILANNDGLQKLTLWRCSAEIAFPLEAIKTYKFKLRMFLYKNCDKSPPTDAEENSLLDFLESQADSLVSLRLEEWMGVGVFKMLFKMPELKELTIDLYDTEPTIDWDQVELHPSATIEKFHIDSYRKNRQKVKIFNALFGAMPNLKFLTMDYLDNEVSKISFSLNYFN